MQARQFSVTGVPRSSGRVPMRGKQYRYSSVGEVHDSRKWKKKGDGIRVASDPVSEKDTFDEQK